MSLVVGTIEELECRLNAFGVALVGAPLGRQLIEALARAEKADSAWRFTNTALEGTQDKLARAQSEIEQLRTRAEKAENARDEATERATRYQRHWAAEVERAEQAERERDAMHAAAEELRAQGAELGENQFKYEGRVVEFSEPTLSGLTYHWTYWEAGETVKLDFANPGYRDAAFVELALAWWIKNAPADLCLTDDGRSVRPMADWTVIEGRAVWRGERWLCIEASKHQDGYWVVPEDALNPEDICIESDVPQSLFLAARRWIGWDRTLTAVDLTELREAWNVWLGSHNSHDWLRFSNALEKLLSSGGAP